MYPGVFLYLLAGHKASRCGDRYYSACVCQRDFVTMACDSVRVNLLVQGCWRLRMCFCVRVCDFNNFQKHLAHSDPIPSTTATVLYLLFICRTLLLPAFNCTGIHS